MTYGRGAVMPDKVLIDTSVWIEFFRKRESPVSLNIREWLKLNQVYYTGPIVVELYQGAKTTKEIQIINQLLDTIHYVDITREHYHHAGLTSQKAARDGKIFSTIDMIIAAVAHDENLSLFSLDHHFLEISHYIDISLVRV